MTGREDNAPAKLETNHKENYQGRDNALRSQEIKQHKRSNGVPNKPLRPNMEIYRPRNNLTKNSVKHGVELTNSGETVVSPKTTSKELLSSKNGVPKEVHFVDSPIPKKPPSPPMGDLKSALKRSKSFTADEGMGMLAGFDREAFPKEDQGLIRRAVLDPNSLSCQKLMELVRLICKKAIESAQFALPAAQLCFSIIEKEHDHTFLESLQNCCREWYNERDRLLRAPVFSSQSGSSMRRWTAYVSFLTELYLQLKGQQHHQPTGPYPNSPMAHMALTLQTLLFECANIILRPPSINSEEEVGTLRRMLFSVGTHLQSDTSQRMDNLDVMGDAKVAMCLYTFKKCHRFLRKIFCIKKKNLGKRHFLNML
ncbi:hypothetical protein JTE90_023870 [Oedothorax gibbosus]|uniref:MIF4G domain-containing protein n=1 Tax=Oedothorax gibbosus TaxID=931172 RepID=A0AAV6UNU4_9ARAC|nr:hypothetical protein JTE90_023870 [Oedothorax gibbosus]